jgi:hypothetical protein
VCFFSGILIFCPPKLPDINPSPCHSSMVSSSFGLDFSCDGSWEIQRGCPHYHGCIHRYRQWGISPRSTPLSYPISINQPDNQNILLEN